MERAKKQSPEQWRKHVQRWKDSGLTAREFAAETGLNFRTLTTWSSRLRDESSGRQRPGARFIEVTEAVAPAVLELVVASVVVRVPVGFDEETLRRVLSVARQP